MSNTTITIDTSDEEAVRFWETAKFEREQGTSTLNIQDICKVHPDETAHRISYATYIGSFTNDKANQTVPGLMIALGLGADGVPAGYLIGSRFSSDIELSGNIFRPCIDEQGRTAKQQVEEGERALMFASNRTFVHRFVVKNIGSQAE